MGFTEASIGGRLVGPVFLLLFLVHASEGADIKNFELIFIFLGVIVIFF